LKPFNDKNGLNIKHQTTMNIFFIDFETTGLSPYTDDIIEIAVKKIDSDDYFETFVTPKKMPKGSLYTYVPPHIVKITGITDKMINENGIIKSVAIQNMFDFIVKGSDKDKPIYIVAHNGVAFDFIFFRKYIYEYLETVCIGIDKKIFENIKYIDTILIAKSYPNKFNKLSQPYLCNKYNIINEDEHRALGDVKALEKLYKGLCIDFAKSKGEKENHYLENPQDIKLYI